MTDNDISTHVMLLIVHLDIKRHNFEGKPRLQIGTLGVLVDREGGGEGGTSTTGERPRTPSIPRTTSGGGGRGTGPILIYRLLKNHTHVNDYST